MNGKLKIIFLLQKYENNLQLIYITLVRYMQVF